MRPHQRRAAQGGGQEGEDPFGHITPPTLDTLEAIEKAFPMTLPDLDPRNFPGGGMAEVTLGQVQRMLGQQDVIQFLRNLANQARGE